jgi:hypothetical protein
MGLGLVMGFLEDFDFEDLGGSKAGMITSGRTI